jgi:hypothetical protein
MLPFRLIKSGVLLASLVVTLVLPMQAASSGFTASLSQDEMTAAGLYALSAGEVIALDRLVAEDFDRMRMLNSSSPNSSFTDRQISAHLQDTGLDRLTPEQLARFNELVATSFAASLAVQLQPRERPRLKDNEVVSLQRRLEVHGGMSFTYGSAGSGRSYRETAGWISYYDPVTGLGISFGFSRFKGDGLYGYGLGYDGTGSHYFNATATPRTYIMTGDRENVSADRGGFKGDGASLRGSPVKGRSDDDIRH